jgi:hypothetical protein
MRTTTEDKSDDTKDIRCEEPHCVLDLFPKYHMKILLGSFNPLRRPRHVWEYCIRMDLRNWSGKV